MRKILLAFAAGFLAQALVAAPLTAPVRGFSLTEWDNHKYDAALDPLEPSAKTESQLIVDKLYELGVRQVNLTPRATMTDPWKSELIPMTPPGERRSERARYLRLIRYIKSKGMAVGIRPIFFVVDSAGKTPYVEEASPVFAPLLQKAAGRFRAISRNPAAAREGLAEAEAALRAIEAILVPARVAGHRSDEWLLRRVRNLRHKTSSYFGRLTGAELVKEAERAALKAEMLADRKVWWHGNIEPEDPNGWFESFKTYLDLYLPLAKIGNVEEFTIGAELYSMTVGIEDRWDEQPYGFPQQWLSLLTYARSKLPEKARVMYDINFTDDKLAGGGLDQFGGEFARWKYRIADLAEIQDPAQKRIWQALVDFWKGLDAIGIDMYRSLATSGQAIPESYDELVKMLQLTSDRFASQIDNGLFEIENTRGVGVRKDVILKEIGFRSVTKGFVDPFKYAGEPGEVNLEHQAAAYEAMFRSFWGQKWDWFKGIVFWDASVDVSRHGPRDLSFSPIGKAPTENTLKKYFKD